MELCNKDRDKAGGKQEAKVYDIWWEKRREDRGIRVKGAWDEEALGSVKLTIIIISAAIINCTLQVKRESVGEIVDIRT
jgi:hypothetical protein